MKASEQQGPQILAPPKPWKTGTALDEFTEIYLALGRQTATHGALSPAEVDAMDISVVAALLTDVPRTPEDQMRAQAEDLTRKRVEAARRGELYTWD